MVDEISNISEIKVKVGYKAKTNYKITCPEDVYNVAKHLWDNVFQDMQLRERMVMLALNRGNEVLGYHVVSIGGTAGTLVDPTVVFKILFNLANSAAFILIHNHPSGLLKPSRQDDKMTQKMKEASELLDFQLIDHLIVSHEGYYSYQNVGEV